MCRAADGHPLFSVRTGSLQTYREGKFFEAVSPPRVLVISMAQTNDGKIWIGTRDTGLNYTSDGKRISSLTSQLSDPKVNALLAIDRDLWIGTDNGLAHWNGQEIVKTDVAPSLRNIQILSLNKDSDSNIWIGTSEGLLRLNKNGVSSLRDSVSGPTGYVNAIFEDREKNLWIGGKRGIERLRASSFTSYSASKDPAAESSGAVYVDASGRRWFAPSAGGLRWEKGEQQGSVKSDGLDHDVVYSLSGSKNELWIGRQRGGLTHLTYDGNRVTTRTFTQANGLAENSIAAVYQDRDGTVWAGSSSSGVTRIKNGTLTTFTVADGLASNTINSILEGSDGTLWFATANGFSSLSRGSWKSYGGKDGLTP